MYSFLASQQQHLPFCCLSVSPCYICWRSGLLMSCCWLIHSCQLIMGIGCYLCCCWRMLLLQSNRFLSITEVVEAVNIPAFILQLQCLDPLLSRPTGVFFASFSVLQIAHQMQHCTVTCTKSSTVLSHAYFSLFISNLPNSWRQTVILNHWLHNCRTIDSHNFK
jgi:hypothetical protein